MVYPSGSTSDSYVDYSAMQKPMRHNLVMFRWKIISFSFTNMMVTCLAIVSAFFSNRLYAAAQEGQNLGFHFTIGAAGLHHQVNHPDFTQSIIDLHITKNLAKFHG